MVPTLARISDRHAPSSHLSSSAARGQPERSAPGIAKTLAISRLSRFIGSTQEDGISERLRFFLGNRFARSTTARYADIWKAWCDWSIGWKVNPDSLTLKDILSFLLYRFDAGVQYKTLRVYVSALSDKFVLGDDRLSQLPEIKAFLAACWRERPPKPKIYPVWHVTRFFAYCRQYWAMISNLSLENLTYKTAMLSGLALVARRQTLHSLRTSSEHMFVGPDAITFYLSGLQKGSRAGNLKQIAVLHRFADSAVDPYSHILEYIHRTEPFRQSAEDILFLRPYAPYRPATAADIARWLCHCIDLTSSDASTSASSHLVRASASSFAYSAGVSPRAVLQAGAWSSEQVFFNHYRLGDQAPVIANSSLQLQSSMFN